MSNFMPINFFKIDEMDKLFKKYSLLEPIKKKQEI